MTDRRDPMKTDCKSLTFSELEAFLITIGEPKYRAGQIFRWLYRGVYDFADMTDLSLPLREKLQQVATITQLLPEKIQMSKQDGTRKYLFGLDDGNAIESVFLRYHHGNSVCISSQAGCRMGCSFCASAIGGLCRNLTEAEMIDQVVAIEKDTGERVGNVVVMGTGEPFDNYENLSRFLELIHDPRGLGLSYRSITVSTCGIISKIEAFARDFPTVNLAISLHTPNDEIRDQLMPINKRYPIADLLEACKAHIEITNRRITFEYALIDGVNDREEHAKALARLLAGMLCHVNLIPLNKIEEMDSVESTLGATSHDDPTPGAKSSVAPSRSSAEAFRKILESRGITATLRREMGDDIDAACGQLRLRSLKA